MSNKASYKERFENLLRISRKISSSLNIGNILEMIRDEAKTAVPSAREACLLVTDPEAVHYTRPLHCAVYAERINCQLCKRGREIIRNAVKEPQILHCVYRTEEKTRNQSKIPEGAVCEIALPISQGDKLLAVLDVIARDGCFFTERDVRLLQDIADVATYAMTNSREHWEMSKQKLTLDKILEHLQPFVPQTVKRIVEKNPFDPSFEKQQVDVSVLFLDVAGYTRISESLARENVVFIIEKYFSSFLDVIYSHGGDIVETAGDGLMVVFQGGDRENALNASRAALDIRQKTVEINKELNGRFEPIIVNMGINSGIASLGMNRFNGVAGTRMTYTATGTVTNLAARIAASATGGDILIGPETAHRISGDINLEDRGLMSFKNVEKPVRIYRLVSPGTDNRLNVNNE